MTSMKRLPYFPQLTSINPAQKPLGRAPPCLTACITFPNKKGRFRGAACTPSKTPFPGGDGGYRVFFLRQKVIFNRSPKSCRAARGQTGVRSRSDGGEEEPAVTQHRALIPTRETQPRSGLLQEGAELRHRQSYWQGNTLGALLPCGEKKHAKHTDPFPSVFTSFCCLKCFSEIVCS